MRRSEPFRGASGPPFPRVSSG